MGHILGGEHPFLASSGDTLVCSYASPYGLPACLWVACLGCANCASLAGLLISLDFHNASVLLLSFEGTSCPQAQFIVACDTCL